MEQHEKTVSTIFEDNLDQLLASKGLLDRFNQGDIKCKFCYSVINKENIHSLLPESGNVSFICSKPECVIMFMGYLEDKSKNKINDF